MCDVGLCYVVLDGYGLLYGWFRFCYGVYVFICSCNGVVFFGCDSDVMLLVWLVKDGYFGDFYYCEFYWDLGWDLLIEDFKLLGFD